MVIALILRFVLLIIFYVAIFVFTSETMETAYWFSSMFIAFSCFLALVTCFKYDAIKTVLEKAKKHKYIYAIGIVIAFAILINLIYYIVPQYCEIEDWQYLVYMGSENEKDKLLAFIFMPYFYDELNILKITLAEGIFSFAFIALAKIREKLEEKAKQYESITKFGIIGYLTERLIKDIFRYKLFIIFYIYILTISSKYLIVYYVKIVGISIIALSLLCFTIRNFLSIQKCIKKNKQKYGKENLVLVYSSMNYKFSFIEDLRNPLHKFHKYNSSSIGKSLLVDANNYIFASYDAIRYNLINMKQYSSVTHAIFFRYNYKDIMDGTIDLKLNSEIEKILEGNNKFIIFSNCNVIFENQYTKTMKQNYLSRYRDKFDLKPIIDISHLKDDDLIIKKNALAELDYIKQKEIDEHQISQNKNIYIKYSLNSIIDSFSYIEYFYSLLKICEYIMHYMALKNIINNPEEIMNKKIKVSEGTLSTWRNSLDYDKEYNKENKEELEIIKSIVQLRTILEFKTNHSENYTFKKDLCQTIIDVRNNLLGHGVITYDVSERIVKYLFVITKEFIRIFENVSVTIEEDEKIKNIFSDDIKATWKEDKLTYLYSKMNRVDDENKKGSQNVAEYLNYETGKRKLEKDIPMKMNKIWTNAKIEEKLGRYM